MSGPLAKKIDTIREEAVRLLEMSGTARSESRRLMAYAAYQALTWAVNARMRRPTAEIERRTTA